jgi:hypothetical protein
LLSRARTRSRVRMPTGISSKRVIAAGALA